MLSYKCQESCLAVSPFMSAAASRVVKHFGSSVMITFRDEVRAVS
jgi:hypothetical protein